MRKEKDGGPSGSLSLVSPAQSPGITRRRALKQLAAAAALPWLASRSSAQASERPNLLLISLDTLRASHMGCFGYERPTTPSLDRLAAGGALFRRAYSPSSWTSPAHASIFTGLWPPAHQIDGPESKLQPNWPTLARQLKALGYSAKALISGPMVDRRYGFEQGFDDFDDHTYVDATDFSGATDVKEREEILLYKNELADLIRRAAEDWLFHDPPPEPWFFFLHFWDIHADYKPPPPYNTRYDPAYSGLIDGTIKSDHACPEMSEADLRHFIALYDGGIEWVDSQIGLFIDTLEQRGLREKTCILLFSDHGEEFFEHGTKGHAHNLYENLIYVPIIASWPGRIPAGAEILTPVSLTDLAPTLIDLAGAGPPDWMQARSLKPLLLGQADSLPTVPLYGSLFFRNRSQLYVLDYPTKLINDTQNKTLELYNLAADPAEKMNLYETAPQLAQTLFQRLQAWWAECEQVRARILAG